MRASNTGVIGVRTAGGTLREDLRAISVIWQREMIRFLRNHVRMATSLVQPVLFLFVLGTGLSPLVSGAGGRFDFRTFMFPGVIAMTVLFTSVMSAMSIVWDREFGFLREILVAPVSRSAIVLGKCLGGATVAGVQGTLILALAGFVHVPYSPMLLVTVVLELFLMAFAMSAFGIVVQFLVMPMFFLSGAIFPISRLPLWLTTLAVINPVTYAVAPMREAVFAGVTVPAALAKELNPGILWGSRRLPAAVELGIVAALGVLMLALAVMQFSHND